MATPVQHFPTAKGEYDPAELGKQCQPLKAWHEVRILPKPPNPREGISGSQRWFTHFVTARKAYTYLQLLQPWLHWRLTLLLRSPTNLCQRCPREKCDGEWVLTRQAALDNSSHGAQTITGQCCVLHHRATGWRRTAASSILSPLTSWRLPAGRIWTPGTRRCVGAPTASNISSAGLLLLLLLRAGGRIKCCWHTGTARVGAACWLVQCCSAVADHAVHRCYGDCSLRSGRSAHRGTAACPGPRIDVRHVTCPWNIYNPVLCVGQCSLPVQVSLWDTHKNGRVRELVHPSAYPCACVAAADPLDLLFPRHRCGTGTIRASARTGATPQHTAPSPLPYLFLCIG